MLNSNFPARSLALTVLACVIPAAAQAATGPQGVWINDTGRGAVEIKECGKALCGHVVWIKDGADAKGCGKQIIGEARPSGGANWGNGWIYSPEKKRRYDVELTPLGDDKLRVVGYAGVKLFSKTMIWKRAPADLLRCGGTETIAKIDAPKPAPAVPVDVAQVEPKSLEVKSPEPGAQIAKVPEVKAPVTTIRETTVRATTPVEAEAPAVKPTQAPASSKPAAAIEAAKSATADAPVPSAPSQPAAEPNAGEERTAQANGENDEAANDEPAGKGKIDLGDIDVSKFLKKTRSGGCQLDLPWVKIEFSCE